ncbi:MAG: HEAT repeat domain-containing protein [Chloroflexota bacterium]|nr:HEAT repeat domain-containing protein [Chloroflexota bacterium]
MNKMPSFPQKSLFQEILDNLQDPDANLELLHLYQLSDLEGKRLQQLQAIWGKIPVRRRRIILENMKEIITDNYLLSYEAISRIAINDDDAQTRALAAHSFFIYETEEIIPTLLHKLENDPDKDVRATCASSLGKFTYLGEIEELSSECYQKIVTCLLNIMRSTAPSIVRRRALEALGFVAHKDVPALIEDAYQSDDTDWCVSALFAMGRSSSSRWKSKVLPMLDHHLAAIRLEAARAVGEIYIKAAIPYLIELLEDENDSIRNASIWSLSQVGGVDEADLLQQLLEYTDDEDETSFIQDALDNLAFNMEMVSLDFSNFPDENNVF